MNDYNNYQPGQIGPFVEVQKVDLSDTSTDVTWEQHGRPRAIIVRPTHASANALVTLSFDSKDDEVGLTFVNSLKNSPLQDLIVPVRPTTLYRDAAKTNNCEVLTLF